MLVANVFTHVNYNIYVAVKRLKSKKTEKAEKKIIQWKQRLRFRISNFTHFFT